MPRSDPFSGMRLSEQAGLGKLDQRLFASESSAIGKPAAKPRTQTETPPSTGPAEPRASVPAPSDTAPPRVDAPEGRHFDLKEAPLYKATFVFTQDELEALEDLKLELRRGLDKQVTKYDLVRAALHMLVEDHAASGSSSYATRKMRRR